MGLRGLASNACRDRGLTRFWSRLNLGLLGWLGEKQITTKSKPLTRVLCRYFVDTYSNNNGNMPTNIHR
jgi:hypothetical protein